ncbi:MAG: hypothetical protein ACI9LO_002067 [Planctomycetota bacterium]|jgi:hypothetical protein
MSAQHINQARVDYRFACQSAFDVGWKNYCRHASGSFQETDPRQDVCTVKRTRHVLRQKREVFWWLLATKHYYS